MLTFFKQLLNTAIKNAISHPKTTISGITAIVTGVGLIQIQPFTAVNISAGLASVIGGIGLVLADDPTKINTAIKDKSE